MHKHELKLFEQARTNAQGNAKGRDDERAVGIAIKKNSIPALHYLIKHGVGIKQIDISGKEVEIPTLKFLLAHGWDINWAGEPRSWQSPFMWSCIHDREKLVWCLKHGAKLATPGEPPYKRAILQEVAETGDIATFEFLRSKRAPLGPCTLHRAVLMAALGHDRSDDPEKDEEWQRRSKARYVQRMAMVRHLVDTVGLDVNKLDFPRDTKWLQGEMGTPLEYIVGVGRPDTDARELTWFLLDRGADPDAALAEARKFDHPSFIEWVEGWEAQRGREELEQHKKKNRDERLCCVQ
ncbi:uncharacterized protein J4E84_002787 [Alternaria hordeiaustralica]|uniref:uncharacterized protein n=1 Tax=Alternaria hordeiaustralica TaxID=1187925 RepID=UPI0020C3F6E1|nr:uncharacterized protein J4E84_002787 [Alternaria hordeiaustralica]KAI4694205.1 hypothetical protein J4E84_002787 [Alternaria hordeiaustralica]